MLIKSRDKAITCTENFLSEERGIDWKSRVMSVGLDQHLHIPSFEIFLLDQGRIIESNSILITLFWGFPGGAVVESLPANAGDTGSSPGLGGSHMPWSNYAREPPLLSLRVWSLCSATREAAIVRGPRTAMKSGPCLPQLEKVLAQKRRPDTAINK